MKQTVELFCGTKSASKIFAARGYKTFTVDNEPTFLPDLCGDILHVEASEIPQPIEILWASPPCQGFSVAQIGRNWYHNGEPKTDRARHALMLVDRTIELIQELQPRYFFIENPVGKLRALPIIEKAKGSGELYRHTVTYCQYGDTRMKPTDIWTNAPWWKTKPVCKAGMPCHEAAPRGSRTGTQGLKDATERGRIPAELFNELLDQYEAAH